MNVMKNIQHIQALRSSFEKLTEEVASLKRVDDKFTLQLKLQALCDLSHLANNIANKINTADIKLLSQIFSHHTDHVTELLIHKKELKKNSAASPKKSTKANSSTKQRVKKIKTLPAPVDHIKKQTDSDDIFEFSKEDMSLIKEFESMQIKRTKNKVNHKHGNATVYHEDDYGSIEILEDSEQLIDLNTLQKATEPASKVANKKTVKRKRPKKILPRIHSKQNTDESASDFINRLVQQNIARHKAYMQDVKHR